MSNRTLEQHLPFVVLGFFTLAIPAGVLVGLSGLGAVLVARTVAGGAILAVVTVGLLLGLRLEWRAVTRSRRIDHMSRDEVVRTAVAILLGTVLTLAIALEFDQSPIVAASLVGIGAALLTPKLAIPAYCGAFVGMTSPELFTTYWHAVIAGTIASGVFVLVQPVFHGIGGKLGTTAFVGATMTVLATDGAFQSDPLPETGTAIIVVAYAIVGAVATFSLHARLPAGPVLASGVIGLVGGLGLPIAYGDIGSLVAAAVFAASFAGMSADERIPNEGWMVLSGGCVGLVFVYTIPYLGGSGGKLGTIAFGSCLAVYGLLGTFHIVRVRHHLEKHPSRDVT